MITAHAMRLRMGNSNKPGKFRSARKTDFVCEFCLMPRAQTTIAKIKT
jgi:hypothetical protein